MVERRLIFAERKLVAPPLACGLRIGGAAEFGGLSAPADFRRSRKLLVLAQLYLPGLKNRIDTFWAGRRPATPDSLPMIGPSRAHLSWFHGLEAPPTSVLSRAIDARVRFLLNYDFSHVGAAMFVQTVSRVA